MQNILCRWCERVLHETLTSAADRSVRMPPPLRVRLGYLYTAGTASSVSWLVTHTHAAVVCPRSLLVLNSSFIQ